MSPEIISSFSDYQSQRSSLINDDRSLRREYLPSNLKLISVKEAEADRIVRRIRSQEAETIWREENTSVPHPFPGMEFLTGTFLPFIYQGNFYEIFLQVK